LKKWSTNVAFALNLSKIIENKLESSAQNIFDPLYAFCEERYRSTKSGNLNKKIVNALGFGAVTVLMAPLHPVLGVIGIICAIIDAPLLLIAKIFKKDTSNSKFPRMLLVSVLAVFVLPTHLSNIVAGIKKVNKGVLQPS
jgi:hypothetical protein